MANNTTLNPGAGGDVIAAEDVSGVKYPVSKIVIGAAGAVEGDVSSTRPLPVVPRNSAGVELATPSAPLRVDPTGATTQPVSISSTLATDMVDRPARVVGHVVVDSGSLSVGNFPATQPVSAAALPLPNGASTSAKQSAPGTAGAASADVLTVQGIASMTALKVDGSAVTQPVSGTLVANAGTGRFVVSAVALPLPAGAASAAKQPALGIAGTPAADVITVQGLSGMTPLKVDASGTTQPVSAAALPLPTGAATAAAQATGNASLASLDGKLPARGQATMSASTPVALASDQPPITVNLPAGSNTIGGVVAQIATGVIYSGTTALTPQFAALSASSLGDNVTVTGVAGKKIRVLKYTVLAGGTVAVKFRTSTGPTDLTGPMPLAANSGVGGAFCPIGLFETAPGDSLLLNLSAATAVGGHLTYVLI